MAAKVCEFISGVNLTFQYRFQGTVPAGSQVDSEKFIFNPLEIKVAKLQNLILIKVAQLKIFKKCDFLRNTMRETPSVRF